MNLRNVNRVASRTATIALIAGAAGSAGLTLYAGQRVGAPRVLFVPFAIWVLSPFALLGAAYAASTRWTAISRAALDGMTLVITAVSLIVYGVAALGPGRPKTPPFVLMAPASWLMIAVVIATAAFASRRSSH